MTRKGSEAGYDWEDEGCNARKKKKKKKRGKPDLSPLSTERVEQPRGPRSLEEF